MPKISGLNILAVITTANSSAPITPEIILIFKKIHPLNFIRHRNGDFFFYNPLLRGQGHSV